MGLTLLSMWPIEGGWGKGDVEGIPFSQLDCGVGDPPIVSLRQGFRSDGLRASSSDRK